MAKTDFILEPKNIKEKDFELVGREAIDIAFLVKENIPIPSSFIVSTLAFDNFVISNNLVTSIASYLKKVRPFIKQTALEASNGITKLIMDGQISDDLYSEVELSYKRLSLNNENPIVTVLNSNIIEERFVPESNGIAQEFFLQGIEDLITHLKQGWANLFSAEALEFRANGYYKGEISVGLIVQKLIRTEVSGVSESATENSRNEIKIQGVYGIENLDSIQFRDTYILDKKSNKIKAKQVVEQDFMYIHEVNPFKTEKTTKVDLSAGWKKNQKLDDESIVFIGSLTKRIEQLFRQDVSIKWGIEAGKLYILSLNPLNLTSQLVAEATKKQKVKKQEPVKVKKDMDLLVKEVLESTKVQNNINQEVSSIDLPIIDKEQSVKDFDLKHIDDFSYASSLYLDISLMETKHLNALSHFAGSFFDGTQVILNNKILPEEHIDNKRELVKLMDQYSLDISTAARCAIHKPMIYQLSTISKSELNQLNIDSSKYKYNLDERFIDFPESLGIEIMALKKSRIQHNTRNLHVCISGLRNLSNLEDIEKVFSASGLRRSSSFKIYTEVCIPSFIFELDRIEKNKIDGVVVNYSKLVKSLAFRSEIRTVDHQVGLRALELISQICQDKNIEFIVRVGNLIDDLLKKIKQLKPQAIIFSSIPSVDQLKIIAD